MHIISHHDDDQGDDDDREDDDKDADGDETIIVAPCALPMLPHKRYDDCEDNDGKDEDCHDSQHRSILCITNAAP